MIKCESCSFDNPATGRYCSNCGSSLAPSSPSEVATEVMSPIPDRPPSSTPSSESAEEGRFLPGTLLADRYRIIALLGSGGMGEVYRASDLKLGQAVALKFLPEATAVNETLRTRFYGEVRIARQVSHPNVCRVYDIGEVDGHLYLSMEYVDGEDLGSLLRRIGRLPGDKAVEIAQGLCAGLAAAHDKGVIHRDLKPANVMIDGRGKPVITDFGLAAVAEQVYGADARSGTPAYMAPEQLTGKEVTAKSDLYSLGLVLYETFTGKRPFQARSVAELARMQEESAPTSPSSVVGDLDPAVERVILRCLQPDPRGRPASALAVAAALPGGDPLAAALAAGETPSPEMVAAAGETEGLRPAVAVTGLIAVVAGLILAAVLAGRVNLIEKIPFDNPPEALANKARDIAQRLGYTERSLDSAYGFGSDHDYLRHLERQRRPVDFAESWPSPVYFWYRASPRYLESGAFLDAETPGQVTEQSPAPILSGMAGMRLDPQGRLLLFEAVPPQVEDSPGSAGAPDWSVLFSLAGLDMTRFQETAPRRVPLSAFDQRAAWTGSQVRAPDTSVRVEAAAWRGKPVYFEIILPWSRPVRMEAFQWTSGERASQFILLTLFLIILLGACLVARRNVRLGRGDRRGAFRLSAFVFGLEMMVCWMFGTSHVPTFHELKLFIMAIGWSLFVAGLMWVLYLALEPYVRRRWPHVIVSWSRILSGRFRDPLVGRDVLIGVVLGILLTLVYQVRAGVLQQFGGMPNPLYSQPLLGVRYSVSFFLDGLASSAGIALLFLFLAFVLRAVLRREWLAATVFVLLFTIQGALRSHSPVVEAPLLVVFYGVVVFVLMRYGALALVVCFFVSFGALTSFPITLDFSAWYLGVSLFVLLSVFALAAYGFRLALAGRPLFKDDLLEQ